MNKETSHINCWRYHNCKYLYCDQVHEGMRCNKQHTSPEWQELMDRFKALEDRIGMIERNAYVYVEVDKDKIATWHSKDVE